MAEIVVDRLEVSVADHCNLRCRACNHASPAITRKFADVLQLGSNLRELGVLLKARLLRLMGGEPLLHPEIDRVLELSLSSGITKSIQVVTNGILLERMSPVFWNLVDSVEVSIYPGVSAKWPKEHSDKVRPRSCDTFYETFSTQKNENAPLVKKIWDTCLVKNSCYGVVGNHFYKCMRSAFIPRAVGLSSEVDGIHVPGLTGECLSAYLNSNQVLESCRHCTGTLGRKFPHEMIGRSADWIAPQNRPIDQMI